MSFQKFLGYVCAFLSLFSALIPVMDEYKYEIFRSIFPDLYGHVFIYLYLVPVASFLIFALLASVFLSMESDDSYS